MKILTFLLFLVFLLPTSSFAGQGAANTCNEPMADAVTRFDIKQGFPWQSVVTPDGCWIFVSVHLTPAGNQLRNRGIAVLRRDRGKIEQRHFVQFPTNGENLALIRNGKVLAVPTERELVFMDIDKLTSGASDPLISRVSDNHFLNGAGVTASRDDSWLFLNQISTAWLSVVDIGSLSSSTGAKIMGGRATDIEPHQPVLSPDGKYLYLPSAVGTDPSWPAVCVAPGTAIGATKQPEGSIQIIDVKRAASDPATAMLATIKAGCSTRRVAVSADGRAIFATAAFDNMVLAFDVQPLETGLPPTSAGKVPVGAGPVGIVAVDGGKRLIVSNANTSSGTLEERQKREGTLTVIDASKIAQGSGAVLGTVSVGPDPRNITVTPDGRTLLVNNNLGTLDVIDIARMTLIVSGSSARSFGQSSPVNGSCNLPLLKPVTDFNITDGHPVTPVSTRDGCWTFVTVFGGPGGQGLAVLRRTATGIERVAFVQLADRPRLMALTPDERTLVVGTGKSVALLDVARLTGGNNGAIIGYVGDSRFADGVNSVAVTPDGKYLFVTQPRTSWISIVDLEKARVSPGPAAIVGGMPMAGTGGLAFSSDGRYLYATSATLNDPSLVPGATDWPLTCGDREGSVNSTRQREGALLVIDVQRAIASPSSAIVSAVRAGCWPGFLTVSPDSNTIFVAATADKAVLAFDIRSRQTPSFIGKAPVGPAAVGIRTIYGGTKIVVANSDQWQHPDQPQTLTVIDASKMTAGSNAVLGAIPSGATPRHMHVTADGRTLLVANDGSSTLQVIDLDRLPLALKPEPAKP